MKASRNSKEPGYPQGMPVLTSHTEDRHLGAPPAGTVMQITPEAPMPGPVRPMSPPVGALNRAPTPKPADSGNVTLFRNTHFFVHAASRPGKERNPLQAVTGNTSIFFKSMLDQIKWLAAEKQRVAGVGTRLLPNPETINPVQIRAFPLSASLETLFVLLGLIASFIAHAVNMFNFPSYEQDEGTYMSSAWAILHGMLQPYPYRYDHPPLGWIQIAGWVQLTGGFFTFGNAINSGRVLMLLYALGSALLVYLIARRLSGSRSTALLALVIFSLSPLSITYTRLVLLDNIGIFWLLLSLYLVVTGRSRLLYIVSAAVCFGIAILSKEIFLICMPAMLYAVWLHSTTFQRKFSLVAFTYIVISLSSSFLLLALLKGELLPTGWLPWDQHPHLSLLDTLLKQVQRTQSEGNLATSWYAWAQSDLLLIVLSIAATVVNLVAGWWHRVQWVLALLALSFWLLLLRGGVVFPYYIIPLIPFMALNIAFALNTIMQWMTKPLTRSETALKRIYVSGHLAEKRIKLHFDFARAILIFVVIAALVPYDVLYATSSAPIFAQHPTSVQTEALEWIRNNVSHNSVIIINNYLYTDLHETGGEGVDDGAIYPYAHVYLNVAFDPELHDKLLHGDWNRIDYIIADTGMLRDIKTLGGQMLLVDRALHHSILREEFRTGNYDQQIVVQVYQVIHTPQGS